MATVMYSMLGIPLKRGSPVDLVEPIKAWLVSQAQYPDAAVHDAVDDLNSIQRLREAAAEGKLALEDQRVTLIKYARALAAMESRFPISKEKDEISSLKFTWTDALRPNVLKTQQNIHFERSAVLFNLGCVLSQVALQKDHKTEEGIKQACQVYQEAAGCFAFIRDRLASKTEVPKPLDLSNEVLNFFERMMLAQAQECFWEKVNADPSKSPQLVARLANEVSKLYQVALKCVNQLPDAASYVDKAWCVHARVKELIFAIQVDLAMRREDDKTTDIASTIPRLRHAYSLVPELLKAAKSITGAPGIQTAAELLAKQVEEMLREVEKENMNVYFRVPLEYSQLPPLQPAVMVKPLIPAGLEAVPADERYFRSIVPDAHTKAVSRYTDLVDTMFRKLTDLLDAATDEDRLRLKEWELPECLEALQGNASALLPDYLRAPLEQWESSGGFKRLLDTLQELKSVRDASKKDLDGMLEQLRGEESDDASFRTTYAARWTRAPSSQLNGQLKSQIAQYQAALDTAGQSDAQLEAKIAALRPSLQSLTLTSAASLLPRLTQPLVNMTNADPSQVAGDLRARLVQLDGLASERAELEEDLRLLRDQDNILPKLLAQGSDPAVDALFDAELKKYDGVKGRIESHAAKHAEALGALGQAVRLYKEVFQYFTWRQGCNEAARSIKENLDKVREVENNFEEGFRFYISLQDRIRGLGQQVGDLVMTRKIERDDLVASIQRDDMDRRMANMTIQQQPRGPAMVVGGVQPPAPQQPPPPPPQTAYYSAPAQQPPAAPQPQYYYAVAPGQPPVAFGQPPVTYVSSVPYAQGQPPHGQGQPLPMYGLQGQLFGHVQHGSSASGSNTGGVPPSQGSFEFQNPMQR